MAPSCLFGVDGAPAVEVCGGPLGDSGDVFDLMRLGTFRLGDFGSDGTFPSKCLFSMLWKLLRWCLAARVFFMGLGLR